MFDEIKKQFMASGGKEAIECIKFSTESLFTVFMKNGCKYNNIDNRQLQELEQTTGKI